MTDLSTLISRLEEATGADREIDVEVCLLWQAPNEHYREPWRRPILLAREHQFPGTLEYVEISGVSARSAPKVTESIDAVLSLAERVLPGWCPHVGQNVHHKHWNGALQRVDEVNQDIISITATHLASPALALLLAILKAKLSEQETQQDGLQKGQA